MSLLLCRQEQVKHPYYMESLGIRLWSSQELSYVIFHYPLLVMDGFVDEKLLEFLREELNQGFLALKIERWLKSGEDPDETLILILQECDYYNGAEISRYRQQIAAIRGKHPAEYKKLRADELFSMRQYGRAVKLYEELLALPMSSVVDGSFQARVWNNIGSCYARMFQTERAFEGYRQSYLKKADQQVLKELYCLTKLDDRLKLGDRLTSLVTGELTARWDQEMEDARKRAAASAQVRELETLFEKDPIKRQDGEMKLLHKWKQEYRAMV